MTRKDGQPDRRHDNPGRPRTVCARPVCPECATEMVANGRGFWWCKPTKRRLGCGKRLRETGAGK